MGKISLVLCSKCAANLPEGSQFCLKCGQPVATPAGSAESPAIAVLACSKCGAPLEDGADFCLKCGKPVSSPLKNATPGELLPPKHPVRRRKRGRIVLWLLVLGLLGVIIWAVSSDSSGAQQLQESIGLKQDRIILDTTFSVGAHTFRYYKFSLPEGSVNVAIVGPFKAAAEAPNVGRRTDAAKNANSTTDNDIEVFVLTEPAFTVWQNGYDTGSLYDSGKVIEGKVQADIPAGAGIYYLVFSNKQSPKTPKTIHASVVLRYKSWLPTWLRTMKGRLWDWLGV
jgi:ribosomal protein L40E